MTFDNSNAATEFGDLEAEYEILDEIGRGGMAVVYRARDRELGREVAVKVIRAKYLDDEEALARLAREARTVAHLHHPNIVTVHAVRRLADRSLALVMQYVPGCTLKQAIQREAPISFARAEQILHDVGEALAYAHRQGVVHRDVKPDNIFLNEETGQALLSDFGIAQSTEAETQLTLTGMAIGTPSYMSPEQIDGTQVDGRSDLYSLGVVAWEMLTGEAPWEGESLYNVLFKQKNEPLPSLRKLRPDTPARLWFAIEGALHKDPKARWSGVEEFLAQLSNRAPGARWRRLRSAVLWRRRVAARFAATREPGRDSAPRQSETVRYRRPSDGALAGVDTPPVTQARPDRTTLRRAAAAAILLGTSAAVVSALSLRGEARRPEPPRGERVAVASPAALSPIPDPAAPPPAVRPDSTAGTLLVTLADSLPADSVPLETVAAPDSVNRPTTPPPTAKSAAPVAEVRRSAPALVSPPAPSRVVMRNLRLATGGMHTCAVAPGGETFCWGGNDRGQLGIGSTARRDSPSRIAGDVRFRTISAGISHTCGVDRSGQAFCWGGNDSGQLGIGSSASRASPSPVSGGRGFRELGTGMAHTCGIRAGGEILCWGDNSHGQLAVGGGTRLTPTVVAEGGPFAELAVGWNHTCALDSGGQALCWGHNGFGQLGEGSNTSRSSPTPVEGGRRFASIAAGSAHTCGLTESGDAYCWGRNSNGQIGEGGTSNRASPAHVQISTPFRSITAGSVHTCALTRGGLAYCWGRNSYGQLGDRSTTDRALPVRVQGGHTFASLQASGAHTCGTTVDGASFCWGYNVEGQLGDGTKSHRTRPVAIETSQS